MNKLEYLQVIRGVLKLLVQDAVNYLISMAISILGILGLWVFWHFVGFGYFVLPPFKLLRQFDFIDYKHAARRLQCAINIAVINKQHFQRGRPSSLVRCDSDFSLRR